MPTSTFPGLGDSVDTNVFVSHLTRKQAYSREIGARKMSSNVQINGQDVEILWDTGAQVSISEPS